MKKRIYIYFLAIFCFISDCIFSQPLEQISIRDTFCVNIKLKEYQVDSCLENILFNVVNADSSHIRFPPSLYYYECTFANYGNYRQLMITPAHWARRIESYYKGGFNINGMYFLCSGDINTDSLFVYTGKQLITTVRSYSSSKYDSLDNIVKWFDWKHSPTAIVGTYRGCAGLPIDLYINVGEKIENIETKYR